MKFDEAETKVENLVGDLNIPLGVEGKLLDVIDKLREEYAPTVEMTKQQRDIIIGLLDDSDICRDDWDTMINDDSPELPEISYRQAIMAYMNPETIKVVDE